MKPEGNRLRALALVFKQSLTEWSNDNAPRLGAALSFYTLLSLAPGIVIILAVAAFAYGREGAQGVLVGQIRDFVGAEVAESIQEIVKRASKPAASVIATVFSLLALTLSASSVFVELHGALNMIWHVPPRYDRTNVATAIRLIKTRLYAFVIVVIAGFLLLVSLLSSAWISNVERFAPRVITLVLTFVIIAALFAAVYKVVPDVAVKWSDVVLGAAVTSLLFMVGKELIAVYFAKTSLRSAYGTAASPLILLLWVYYSAQLFFWGAEFTKVYSNALGSRRERLL